MSYPVFFSTVLALCAPPAFGQDFDSTMIAQVPAPISEPNQPTSRKVLDQISPVATSGADENVSCLYENTEAREAPNEAQALACFVEERPAPGPESILMFLLNPSLALPSPTLSSGESLNPDKVAKDVANVSSSSINTTSAAVAASVRPSPNN